MDSGVQRHQRGAGSNQFRAIDLLAAPGVIEGQVLRENETGRHGVGGVTVMITEKRPAPAEPR